MSAHYEIDTQVALDAGALQDLINRRADERWRLHPSSAFSRNGRLVDAIMVFERDDSDPQVWIRAAASTRFAEAAGRRDTQSMREAVSRASANGLEGNEIVELLTELMLSRRADGDEQTEDFVADCLDRVVGWCHPDSRWVAAGRDSHRFDARRRRIVRP